MTELDLNKLIEPEDKPEEEPQVKHRVKKQNPKKNIINVYQFLNKFRDKITGVSPVDMSNMKTLTPGEYMLFVTQKEKNNKLIFLEDTSYLWLPENLVPDSIKVKSSGVIIKNGTSRSYISKNNVVQFVIENGKVSKMIVFGKAKTPEAFKATEVDVIKREVDVPTLKLFIKNTAPRLYAEIETVESKEEIKTKIETYMNEKIKDINHFIKIEKDILCTCQV